MGLRGNVCPLPLSPPHAPLWGAGGEGQPPRSTAGGPAAPGALPTPRLRCRHVPLAARC